MPIRERVSALNEERSKRLQAEATVAQLQAQLQAAIEQAGTCELNLIESDRLAALGLLTAGIAHELNSPLGYVSSNVSSLQEYLQELQQHVSSARTFLDELDEPGIQTGRVAAGLRELLDNQLGTLLEDATDTLQDTLEGTRRIAGIVGGLRDYSRYDDDWDMANIVACLKSTLKLARNEFKSGCKLVVQVSKLPDSYFNHGKLAQVFLNLLVNAGHAVDEQGLVKVSCAQHGDTAVIEVSDNGCGIAERG
ncbi:MAG: ATP-binding protein, partial [Pseudomonadota bacterium]